MKPYTSKHICGIIVFVSQTLYDYCPVAIIYLRSCDYSYMLETRGNHVVY